MNLFEVLNYSALSACIAILIKNKPFYFTKTDILISFYVIVILSILSIWTEPIAALNSALLLLSLKFFNGEKLDATSFSTSPNVLGKLVLIVLLVLPLILTGSVGWVVVFGVAIKYWFIFLSVIVFIQSGNLKTRTTIALLILCAGLFWRFKFALLVFLFVFVQYIFSSKSILKSIPLILSILLLGLFVIYFQGDRLYVFLNDSVLRPDYEGDLKVLGFSDGNRIAIWLHYLENAVFIGKGDYQLPFIVPTHNIFVSYAHDFGLLGFFLISPVFLYLLYRLWRGYSPVFSLLILTSFSLSSIGEYAAIWVPCIVIMKNIADSRIFNKKIGF